MRRGGPRHGPPHPPTLGRAPAEPWRASGWIEDVSSDPAVHHAHGLAGRPLERAGRAQADLGAEGERVVQVALDPRRDAGVAARLGLDDDGHPLAAALGLEHDLVLVLTPACASSSVSTWRG